MGFPSIFLKTRLLTAGLAFKSWNVYCYQETKRQHKSCGCFINYVMSLATGGGKNVQIQVLYLSSPWLRAFSYNTWSFKLHILWLTWKAERETRLGIFLIFRFDLSLACWNKLFAPLGTGCSSAEWHVGDIKLMGRAGADFVHRLSSIWKCYFCFN